MGGKVICGILTGGNLAGGSFRVRLAAQCALLAALALVSVPRVSAQAGREAGIADPRPPRVISPIDLTGYWVSVVTEDWRFRMIVPDKGDYSSVPLNDAARKVADSWDPSKDQADGNQCKSYGAASLMRVPGRLHITWEGDSTLRIDTDSGTQTRLLHFGGTPALASQAPQWQGYSVAEWQGLARRIVAGGPGQDTGEGKAPEGYLAVTTTHLRPGYLRKNGVPYSANALLEEYFDSFKESNGDTWMVVTTVVTDPQYLLLPFVTSTHFKKLSDASGWDPTPCRTNEPR